MVDASDGFALSPISEEDPCGPDLDLVGDSEFMNFMAALEGQLPASYFAFDRKTIDFPVAFETAEKLLQRTLDIRLLVLLAKLAILNRDLGGFARWVGSIAWLLTQYWEAAHPRAEDGDYFSRLAQLGTLDDGPVVVLPLQYAPLLETRRDGVLAFRSQLIALGDAKPREGETLASSAAMDRILSTVEMEALSGAVRTLEGVRAALASIHATTAEKVGYEQAVGFKALGPMVDRMAQFLVEAQVKRDPSLAAALPESSAEEGADEERREGAAAAPGAFATLEDIDAALGAALGYFATREPSSPALLLIGQARKTLGKNLYDVMQLLAPNHADNARVFVGPDGAFTVPVRSLSVESVEISRGDTPPAASRAAALALIDAVASHMRKVEPSSPAPYLLERAKALASRDFLSLLHDVLPEDDLNSMKQGN